MSFAFQIPVICRVACLAIVSLAFIAVVLLLSTVTDDPNYLNLFTLSISLPSINTLWVPISAGLMAIIHVFAEFYLIFLFLCGRLIPVTPVTPVWSTTGCTGCLPSHRKSWNLVRPFSRSGKS